MMVLVVAAAAFSANRYAVAFDSDLGKKIQIPRVFIKTKIFLKLKATTAASNSIIIKLVRAQPDSGIVFF